MHGTCDNCTHDRTGFGPGPWDQEPDRFEFVHKGLNCLLHRSHLGSWCGYVGVGPSHPHYGKGYNDVDFRVHGGLTYAAMCSGAICHIPKPGEPDDLWWFGFDTAHCYDIVPGLNNLRAMAGASLAGGGFPDMAYRDMFYVRGEVMQLADQLVAAAKPQGRRLVTSDAN